MRIILRVHKLPKIKQNLSGHVRITPEAEIIIRQLQRETGLSATSVASQIITQAGDFIEIAEVGRE